MNWPWVAEEGVRRRWRSQRIPKRTIAKVVGATFVGVPYRYDGIWLRYPTTTRWLQTPGDQTEQDAHWRACPLAPLKKNLTWSGYLVCL